MLTCQQERLVPATGRGMQENRYHHGNLREALLDSAMHILAQPDEEKITLRMLAGRLGVSRTAPYRHFKSKSTLMAAVAARGFSLMRNTFRDELQSGDTEKAICEIMEDYVTFATENPRLYRLMFSGAILESPFSDDLFTEAQLTFNKLSGILEKLKLDVSTTSSANIAAWAMVHGISLLIIEKLLTVTENGDIFHTLINKGKTLTSREAASQIRSAAKMVAAGIAHSTSATTV